MKLHAYLNRSRHGIFYFRWPIPRTDGLAARRTLRLSLGTRCPREAGSHRWATLIAMFTGARLNEVCQSQLKDIRQEGGLWLFDFTEAGADDKRLKSKAAQRRVPVHSQLIELGLLKYHARLKVEGRDRLFPDYTYSSKSGYGDKLSKWFNRTFTKSLGIKSKAHVFHGLRHTFATRLNQADVETERVQFIVGHERQGVTHQVYMREGLPYQRRWACR